MYRFSELVQEANGSSAGSNPSHTDIMAIIIEKPLLEFTNWVIKGGKEFLLVKRLNATGSFDNCGNEKWFVNIDTTTGLVSNFHGQIPFGKDTKPLTELPHD